MESKESFTVQFRQDRKHWQDLYPNHATLKEAKGHKRLAQIYDPRKYSHRIIEKTSGKVVG